MMSHIDQVSLISRKESFQMTMELESVKQDFKNELKFYIITLCSACMVVSDVSI